METLRAILALPPGASSFADGIDLLHLFVISITMLMSTYIFLTAATFTARWYRGEKAPSATTPIVTASRLRETIIITGVLGTFLLWWVIGFVQYANMSDPPDDAQMIVVTAKQWMWTFTYPDGRETNDILTLPVDRNARLVLSSRDVVHSFYVPQFRIKHDVLPGRYMTTWFRPTKIGTFDIFCAEYCGLNHSRMLGRVVVLSQSDYEKWLRDQSGAVGNEEIAARGVGVATRRACVACHTLDGQAHVGPSFARLYGRNVSLADGRTIVADDAYLTRSMMEPNVDVVAGYKSAMPSYAGQLTPGEVGALVELIRSLKDGAPPPGIVLPRLEISVDAGALQRDPYSAASDGGTR
jgi:cytochrome c oxidase subunit 2